jgi:DNA topoisomerase-2
MDYVRDKLNTEKETMLMPNLIPHYNGFKGSIIPLSESKHLIKGVYAILSDKQVRITELPIGTWTDDYKKYIEELIEAKTTVSENETSSKKKPKKEKATNQVKDYIDMSTDTTVDITITFAAGIIPSLKDEIIENNCTALEKLLKLYTTRSTTNMHVFDEKEKLVKCDKVEELVERYMKVRMDYYVKRKAYQIVALEKESTVLSNKARFISELLEDTLDLRKKKTAEVSAILKERDYAVVDEDTDYKYLVRLPMDSVTEENVNKIMNERDRKNDELATLQKTSETQLWLNELAILRTEYVKMASSSLKNDTVSNSGDVPSKKTKVVKKK